MVSFLSLMDTIKLRAKALTANKDLIMTQYMLKMLTILTNFLVSNLIALQLRKTKSNEHLEALSFISELVVSLNQPKCDDMRAKLSNLDRSIPISASNDTIERNALSYGCSLLKELAFKFVTYVQAEVSDSRLRALLLREYATVVES